ncbi:MAG: hypothetical protein HND47_18580 [Chloroflexi bacterium]|nr:hypothetical protein [Chloroflexota bacterium]
MENSLLPFFRPKGIVVIGASTSAEKLGYGVARNLILSGYPGAIHFVAQKSGELFGRKIHTDLQDVPNPVDGDSHRPHPSHAGNHRGLRQTRGQSGGHRLGGVS